MHVFSKPLLNISIDEFEPMTDSTNVVNRKNELKDKLQDKIPNLDEIKKKCKNTDLSVNVCFNLYDKGNEGSREKDLDNLLKILLDALTDNLEDDKNKKRFGIISNDKQIFHIDCRKKFVSDESQSGIDLKIYRYRK